MCGVRETHSTVIEVTVGVGSLTLIWRRRNPDSSCRELPVAERQRAVLSFSTCLSSVARYTAVSLLRFWGVNEMRIQGKKWRWWLSVVLMIAGLSILVVALVKQSVVLAILGVASMAIASATPEHRRPWEVDNTGPSGKRPE